MDRFTVFSMLQIIRIVALSILMLPIPLTIRLLALYVIDIVDCNPLWHPVHCHSFYYQWNDKMVDTITYIVVVAYMFINHSSSANYVLLAMLLYRMLGLYKWKQSRDPMYLVYYPDLVREFSLVVAAASDGWIPKSPRVLITGAIIIALVKPMVEYRHHIVANRANKHEP